MPSPSPQDERRPLLAGSKSTDNGAIERGPSNNNDESTNDAADTSRPEDSSAFIDEPTSLQITKALSACYLGSFLAALDSTLVATLSGPISSSFNSLTLFSWLASSYFIANSAFQPLIGKLTDIFGRRDGLIVSNIFFAVGNLMCGLANDEWVMILGRIVAGIGGGCITPISTFVASDIVPLRRRGTWQGIANIVFGIGAGVGGLFGGWMNDTIGWRWAFLIQVPATLVSMVIIIFTIKNPVRDAGENRWKRVDIMGAILLIVTLVLLLLGLNSGGNVVPWNHPLVYVSLPLSAVAGAAYIYVEAKVAPEPIIPMHLMMQRTTLAACLTNWFTAMAVFALLFYVPVYFQARGYTATQAGERLVSNSVGVAFGSITVGVLMRWLGRYWWLNVGVQTVLVTGFALTCTLDRYTPDWPPFIYFLFTGSGYTGMLTITLISLVASVDQKWQAVITSASYLFRSTGATIGITAASAIFQNVLTASLWRELGGRDGGAADAVIPRVRDSLDAIKDLPPEWRGIVIDCYMLASRAVFLSLLGLALLAAAISLFIEERKLHKTLSRRDS